MQVKLAYGREGLVVNVPDGCDVVEPVFHNGLADERTALAEIFNNPLKSPPLKQLVKRTDKVAIAVCDRTRPVPNERILPPLLEELSHVLRENLVILIGTGSHRANAGHELEEMLGADIVRNYRVVNHTAFDKGTLTYLGETSTGIPLWIDRLWVEADVRIAIGLVEPHFFAGFSGGPKLVAPALAGIDTIMRLHSAELIADPRSIWGVVKDNPIHKAIREIASRAPIHFSLNVIVNKRHEIVRAFGGELRASHEAACKEAKRIVMRSVAKPYDIVITTNSGYPLDQNLYQTVKGMSAAAQIVKRGGHIIAAAECSDGIPSHGQYGKILASLAKLEDYLDIIRQPGYSTMDQWQVQLQAQIQQKATVYLKSGLSDEVVRQAHITPIRDVEEALQRLMKQSRNGASACILPEGPQTIPYVEERVAARTR
jgi:nickel-dependent lactate racemase